MTNRRHCVRHRRRLKVTIGRTSCFSTDISAGGFCAELVRGLAPGTGLEGSIHIEGQTVRFAGAVAWVKAGDVGLSLRSRIGVRFTQIAQDFPGLLERYEASKRAFSLHDRLADPAPSRWVEARHAPGTGPAAPGRAAALSPGRLAAPGSFSTDR